ncbi:MAG: hypothetical protein JWO76_2551 [Nocardioides sp.]|nr:hypothetical protein [Nocardioides sp.]
MRPGTIGAMSRSRRLAIAVVGCVSLLLPAGCVRMPESGPVVEARSGGNTTVDEPAYIVPKPPQPGDSPADVVKGFLDAMTAFPIEFTVARQFLSVDARASWNPGLETITYADASTPRGAPPRVSVTLTDADALDERGAWTGPVPRSESVLPFPVARDEDGEWRITEAPNALVVPETWFEQRYRQVAVYFFDPSARVLVPEPVFVPLGEQLATTLTAALLRGPGPQLADVSRSFIPPGLKFSVSVPVSADGVADIALTGDVGQQTPQAIDLMLAQFTWTLRQEPSIRTVRVTIGDQAIQLPGQDSDVSVAQGGEYDPTGFQASSLLFGLREGLLVSGPPDALEAVDGPLGTTRYGLSEVAVNLNGTTAAAVSGKGRSVLVAPVRAPGKRVREIVSGATDLLRPAWDIADRLWLVDRASRGARVLVREAGRTTPVEVPGISSADVRHFLVSRDGSRLVAVVRRPGRGDALMVSRIRHDTQGRVLSATSAKRIAWQGEGSVAIRDIGWSGPTKVVALQALVGGQLFAVRTISVDGSPPGSDSLANTLTGKVLGLVSSPVPSETLYAATTSLLLDQTNAVRQNVPLDSRITSLGYVG